MRRLAALAVGVVLIASAACADSRDDVVAGFPGAVAPSAPDVFEPGTVPAAARAYVDELAVNFVEGVRLAARLDEEPAQCVAERWVATLDPAALDAAGVPAEQLRSITLDELGAAVPSSLDEPRVRALVAAFPACDVEYESAVLDSLQVTGQLEPGAQRFCLADALADDLLESITLSVLLDAELDPALGEQYAAAVETCPI